MDSIFSRFVSNRKHLRNMSRTVKQKNINTQADMISEIEKHMGVFKSRNYW